MAHELSPAKLCGSQHQQEVTDARQSLIAPSQMIVKYGSQWYIKKRSEGRVRILKTKWFTRFATKNSISDLKLKVAIDEVERGVIDADLGGGLVKKRIARNRGGKSGGYRTIIAYRKSERAFFIFGFAKNEMGNIDEKDLADLKEAARQYANLTDTEITAAVVIGQLTEIT